MFLHSLGTGLLTVGGVDAGFTGISSLAAASNNISLFADSDVLIEENITSSVGAGATVTISTTENITFNTTAPVAVTTNAGTINVTIDSDSSATTEQLILGQGSFTASTINFNGSNNDEIIAQDDTNTWVITGGDSGTLDNSMIGTNPANFSNFANLIGGTGDDSFNITTGSISGYIDGDVDDSIPTTGTDTLTYAGGPTATISITGAGSLDGFTGNATNITGGFDNINAVYGSNSGSDTLIGHTTDSTWDITNGNAGPNTYTTNPDSNGDRTLVFGGFANLTGNTGADEFNLNTTSFTGNIDGGAGGNVFNINADLNGNLSSGDDDDELNLAAEITGTVNLGDGVNTFNLDPGGLLSGPVISNSTDDTDGDIFNFDGGSISGAVTIDGNATWNAVTGVPFTTSTVTGTGNLQIPYVGNVIIGTDLILSQFSGFSGHLIVGGSIEPIVGSMAGVNTINIDAVNMSLSSPLVTAGNITLLAHNIDITNNISAGGPGGGELAIIGVDPGPGVGSISASAGLVTLEAGSGVFVTDGSINNSINMNLQFNGGTAEAATGASTVIQFNPASNVTPAAAPTPSITSIIAALVGAGAGVFNVNQIQIINPAADLIGLEELGFIDTGLFEEDLTLFGVIGYGIALALAQCEEIEGCAPNVTEEELNELIAQLEARIAELEKRCEDGDTAACALLEGYREELGKFVAYREELQQYLTAGTEEFDDEFTADEFGDVPVTGKAASINILVRMLEAVKARVQWLESLMTDPEARALLGSKTGIELTQEALNAIIEGAKAQLQFIEKQIKLLREGTQARLDAASPVFVAESADYSRIQTVVYGPSLLNLDQEFMSGGNWN